MRKIKFRAWEKSVRGLDARGMMWQSDETFKDYVVGFDGSVYEKFMDNFAGQSFDNYRDVSDNFVLMQYTGLKDKNGREIYEGDILSFLHLVDPTTKRRKKVCASVTWAAKFAEYDLRFTPISFTGFADKAEESEVIGNIYEDPELLREVEK